jgi:SAM-dependent methyltransferase
MPDVVPGLKPRLRFLERLPMMRTLDRVNRVIPGLGRLTVKLWYHYMTRLDRNADMIFMNYGFADLDDQAVRVHLEPDDEKTRLGIQLYHHVAGSVDLRGKDVLEVGSGRGGGASYVARYLGPRSMMGVDVAEPATRFCCDFHAVANLRFRHGDAEALPFPDGSFDAIINVESSHCYPSMARFVGEVHRLLRPGGHFLIADRRTRTEIEKLRAQLTAGQFELERAINITPNILRALDLDEERKLALIYTHVPALARKAFKQFAATKGTSLYESFRTGSWEYWSFVLRKK